MEKKKTITVALAGNPNVGKTTILNALAGTSLKVGNWPGVTVERKEATVPYGDYLIHFIDLPGIYTLEPISDDERVASEFLKNSPPDVILNVIDSTNPERSFLLTAELLEFEKPTLLLFNLYDEAKKLGIEIDEKLAEELLGVKAFKTVGRKGEGLEEVLPAIVRLYEEGKKPRVNYSPPFEEFLKGLGEGTKHRLISDPSLREKFKKAFGLEAHRAVEEERLAFARGLFREVVKQRGRSVPDFTDLLDSVVLHPLLGVPLFFIVLLLVFKLSFDLSAPWIDWIELFFDELLTPLTAELLSWAPPLVRRFVAEALIGGVGFVLTFLPLVFTLYFFITLLEMSGYIPRVAFTMDKFLHKLGLHGKSVIPLVLALGCNVPALLATRTLESFKEKLLVVSMIPFISCPARLVVFAFFASIFFPHRVHLVILSLYLLGFAVALLTAFLLRKSLKVSASHLVIELPPYRLPPLKSLLLITWVHVKDFLYRAGTVILGASVAVWLLLNLPPGAPPSESYASKIGKALLPVFKPIGIEDWRATTSLVPAFLAREIVISSMGVIYGAEEQKEEEPFSLKSPGSPPPFLTPSDARFFPSSLLPFTPSR